MLLETYCTPVMIYEFQDADVGLFQISACIGKVLLSAASSNASLKDRFSILELMNHITDLQFKQTFDLTNVSPYVCKVWCVLKANGSLEINTFSREIRNTVQCRLLSYLKDPNCNIISGFISQNAYTSFFNATCSLYQSYILLKSPQ